MADAGALVVATGVITGPEARGQVTIEKGASGEMVVRISDVWIAGGAPDVRVYLTSDPTGDLETPTNFELGKVSALSGDLEFAVPGGVDLPALHALVVCCDVYSVTFGIARLEHRAA